MNESELQSKCKSWFDWNFPQYQKIFFSVPNGGYRTRTTALRMKNEGLEPGVADMILLKGCNGFGSLCIEFKTKIGRQSNEQKVFQFCAEANGNKYVICRTFEEFKSQINDYLKESE